MIIFFMLQIKLHGSSVAYLPNIMQYNIRAHSLFLMWFYILHDLKCKWSVVYLFTNCITAERHRSLRSGNALRSARACPRKENNCGLAHIPISLIQFAVGVVFPGFNTAAAIYLLSNINHHRHPQLRAKPQPQRQ